MLHYERNLMRPHFENRPRAVDIARSISKTRIKETRIVNAKLADGGIEWHHLGGILRRNPHTLTRSQYVKILRIQNQRMAVVAPDRVPELLEIVVLNPRQIDQRRMLLRAVSNHV